MKNLVLLLITGFLATLVFAEYKDFKNFDLDWDGLIEIYEFVDVFGKNYTDDWDNTDDTGLDDEDFYVSTYAMLNADDNTYLDANEWAFGYNYLYGDYLYDDYVLYDTDGDGFIEYTEYYDTLYDSDFYLSWDIDRDGYLDQYELAYAVFDNWDINENYVLNRSEFTSFDLYYLDI